MAAHLARLPGFERNRMMMDAAKSLDFLLVRYEDLCADYQKTMDRIFGFIGVESIEIEGNLVIPRQNMIGRKKHFKLDSSPDFNEKSLSNLSKEDFSVMNKELSEMMEYFKYERK